ncbi:MAG: rod shape-determining protein RodA [Alphaproteobacteria bacterium]
MINNNVKKGPEKYFEKIKSMDWVLLLCISALALVGFVMQYSVAGGSFFPWALQQGLRYIFAVFLMIAIAVVDIRFWYRWAWVFFAVSVGLLFVVELFGYVGMGAKRWIDLKVFKLQPSELVKIFVIVVLARYYTSISLYKISSLRSMCILGLILIIPAGLVYRQPDLGTAILIMAGGLSVAFMAGLSWRWIIPGITLVVASVPFIWSVVLRPYQQKRILTFLNPESDPLGKGYHIMQSKIAIGSGGMTGQGLMQGRQTQLGFLPEKHTDFIFTVIAEELGFIGSSVVLMLILFILFKIFVISHNVYSSFAKLVVMGMGTTFFLYVIINIGMVMGLFPVVGVPLPLVSYGGTVMITIMVGFGFIQNMWVHRTVENPSTEVEN